MQKELITPEQFYTRLKSIETMLTEQNTLQKEVLDFNEAAKYLALSKSHLYKLTSTGKIPHYKPESKKIYFNRAELDKWMLRNPVKTAEQIELEANTYLSKNKRRA